MVPSYDRVLVKVEINVYDVDRDKDCCIVHPTYLVMIDVVISVQDHNEGND